MSGTISVTGSGLADSYSTLPITDKDWIESLDGRTLHFQKDNRTNFGPVAGSIVVIPEPSVTLLGLAGLGLVSRRKRTH